MPDTTTSTQDRTKQAAADVASDARGKAADLQQSATSEARSVARDAKDQASDVLGTARQELRAQASEQATSLSGTLTDFSRQLGDMADGSSEQDAQLVQLARSAADSLSQRAQRLDEGGIDGVVGDVKRFARNRPGTFLLGSIAVGFAVGRLAKHADLQQAGQHAKGEIDTEQLKPGETDDHSRRDVATQGDGSRADDRLDGGSVDPLAPLAPDGDTGSARMGAS